MPGSCVSHSQSILKLVLGVTLPLSSINQPSEINENRLEADTATLVKFECYFTRPVFLKGLSPPLTVGNNTASSIYTSRKLVPGP